MKQGSMRQRVQSTGLKIQNHKFQIPNKLQISISNDRADFVLDLVLGICLEFGARDLVLQYRYALCAMRFY
jgi:hypothetical protein